MTWSALHICWAFSWALGVTYNVFYRCKHAIPGFIEDSLAWGKTKSLQRLPLRSGLPPLNFPKSWFIHFYAWGVLWDFSLLAFLVCVYCGWKPLSLLHLVETAQGYLTSHDVTASVVTQERILATCQWEVIVALVMHAMQVARRLYECLCVSVFSKDAKMHLVLYAGGFAFYTLNGTGIVDQLNGCNEASDTVQFQWYHIAGVILFLYASYHQYRCHVILAELRCAGSQSYGFPRGDWFEYVTSPHYLAEVLIYFGIAMVMGFQNIWTLSGCIFSALWLTFGALNTHDWYLAKYKDECEGKHAILPYIL